MQVLFFRAGFQMIMQRYEKEGAEATGPNGAGWAHGVSSSREKKISPEQFLGNETATGNRHAGGCGMLNGLYG